MPLRDSRARLAFLALALAACSSSSGSREHGPAFAEAGADGATGSEAGAEAGSDAESDALAEARGDDAPSDAAGVDAPADSNSQEAGGGDSGAPCSSTMALLAAGSSSLAEAAYSGGKWSPASTVSGGASGAPSLVALGTGYLGAFVGTGATNDLPLKWVGYDSSWTTAAAIGAALAQGTPALAVLGTTGHVVYWGSDGKFYHGTYSGSAWDSASDPLEATGDPQSFGSSAPAAAGTGTTLVAAQSGQNGTLYDQSLSGGAWAAAIPVAGSSVVSTLSPAIVAMNGGAADLMMVFIHAGDSGSYYLQYATRTAGAWSTPANVYAQGGDVAYAGTTPALTALPGGGAIVAWEGGSPANPYVSTYTAAGGWTAPTPAASAILASPPSLAPGICGADAELAYVTTSGSVEVAATTGGTWGTPQTISGATGMQWVALASIP